MSKTLVDLPKPRAGKAYHTQCKRCFMTGKACIYQREIAQYLRGNGRRVQVSRPELRLADDAEFRLS